MRELGEPDAWSSACVEKSPTDMTDPSLPPILNGREQKVKTR
jgi:hypothetical protein